MGAKEWLCYAYSSTKELWPIHFNLRDANGPKIKTVWLLKESREVKARGTPSTSTRLDRVREKSLFTTSP